MPFYKISEMEAKRSKVGTAMGKSYVSIFQYALSSFTCKKPILNSNPLFNSISDIL